MPFHQRIVLARHGVTDLTASGRWDGRGGLDPQLNADGHNQAKDLAERYLRYFGDSPVLVKSSTLNRAKQTAVPIATALGVPVIEDPDWDELSFGNWDGKSGIELRREFPDEIARFWFDETFRVPNGESHVDLHSRVRPSFERLLDSGESALIVTHWGPIMSVLSLLLGIELQPARRLMLAPTSITSIVIGNQGPAVQFINDLGPSTPVTAH